MGSNKAANWNDEGTTSESWAVGHSTALAILGACVAGAAFIVLACCLIGSCVIERRKNAKARDEEMQMQQDPFTNAQISAKNAAFEEPQKQQQVPVGKWMGADDGRGVQELGMQQQQGYPVEQQGIGHGSYGIVGTQHQEYSPQQTYAPYAQTQPQYFSQQAYGNGLQENQYTSWYRQQQQQQVYYADGQGQAAYGWPQQPVGAPPVKTTGAWS